MRLSMGPATLTAAFWKGMILSRYQRASSGKASSCSVAPVGAQSTTTTSYWPLSASAVICIKLANSSMPGRTLVSSATRSLMPRQTKTAEIYSCTRPQCNSI
jgi:hypothetical protein